MIPIIQMKPVNIKNENYKTEREQLRQLFIKQGIISQMTPNTVFTWHTEEKIYEHIYHFTVTLKIGRHHPRTIEGCFDLPNNKLIHGLTRHYPLSPKKVKR